MTACLVERTRAYVRARMTGEGSGHDWFHVERVERLALRLAREEGADELITRLAALLHDIDDWKFAGGDESAGPRHANEWLASINAPDDVIQKVCSIIAGVSYKGAGVETPMATPEGRVVQDADRLDALGAIGIARTFAYGGHKGRALHDPAVEPRGHASFEDYKASDGPTLNHFYEKLLLLKDRLHTDAARRLARERHAFMEQFLASFLAEWEGED